ncbi:MAG: glutamate mutase [Desulfitibacter sp. BRH_c19]|nr:MAG: glutamate mutase [Desulfitibacter sp. BRH_c19]
MIDKCEKTILVYDVGSTYTKLTAFKWTENKITYVGRSQAPTTIDDIVIGLQNAKYNLFDSLDDICTDIFEEFATSSAAGGLRMVAMGYMPRVTAKAAKEVAMNAGARVLEIISFEDAPDYKVEVLREINPDIILLAGGTDGGDEESVIQNANIISQSKINTVVIIAGNANIQPRVETLLDEYGIKSIRVANVMPTIHQLKVKPAREAIHDQFIRQITKAKGLSRMTDTLSNKKVIPTPGAVLLGAELLANGTYKVEGIGDLIIVDIGGATTDIHSILPSLDDIPNEERGLIITNEKQVSYRTVEGNLGLRISATGIIEAASAEAILKKVGIKGQNYEEKLRNYALYLEKNPDYISNSTEEEMFDEALAITAVEIALKRHAGYFSQSYDPIMGIAPGTPVGRDLRRVKKIICVGGIFTHSSIERVGRIVSKATENRGFSLLPITPEIIIDKLYLTYAIGAIGEVYPDQILDFAKEYFTQQRGELKNES